jgi:protein-S-isoprenylcysteine O-methyltransferase Ste14
MSLRQWAGFFGVWPLVVAPVLFGAVWRWFDFFRRRPLLFYAYFAMILGVSAVATVLLRRPLFGPRFAPPAVVQAIGWILVAVSCGFGFVADRQIGWYVRSFLPFFGGPGSRRIELKTGGAYGVVRHPIYAAGGVFQLGVFLLTGYWSVLAGAVVFTAGATRFTKHEEEQLMALLDDPSEYERYRARVPALFPWRISSTLR